MSLMIKRDSDLTQCTNEPCGTPLGKRHASENPLLNVKLGTATNPLLSFLNRISDLRGFTFRTNTSSN